MIWWNATPPSSLFLNDSPPVRHHHQPFQATAAHILLIYRLSDKPIVTHHKFYQTVAILQTQFPLLALFPCLQVRKKIYLSLFPFLWFCG